MSSSLGDSDNHFWGSRNQFLFLISLFLSSISQVSSIFVDEVGKFDFLISTAGHGGKGGVESALFTGGSKNQIGHDNVIVTTGRDSCFISGRNVADGTLLWRRNSCSKRTSSEIESRTHFASTLLKNQVVVTLDLFGVLRGWAASSGEFLFDSNVSWISTSPGGIPKLLSCPLTDDGAGTMKGAIVVIESSIERSDVFSFHSDITGHSLLKKNRDPFVVEQFLNAAKVRKVVPSTHSAKDGQAKIISVESFDGSFVALIGWVFSKMEGDDVTTLSNLAIVEFGLQKGGYLQQINKAQSIKVNSSSMVSSPSIQLLQVNGKLSLVAFSQTENSIVFVNGIGSIGYPSLKTANLPSDWINIVDLQLMDSFAISVSGTSSKGFLNSALFSITEEGNNMALVNEAKQNEAHTVGTSACINNGKRIFFTLSLFEQTYELNVYHDRSLINRISLGGILDRNANGDIVNVRAECPLENDQSSLTSFFITTTAATSAMINILLTSSTIESSWVQEESLASINDMIFLDRSFLHVTDDNDTEDNEISISRRLSLQWHSLQSSLYDLSPSKLLDLFSASSSEAKYERDFHFGFAKVAVLLSSCAGRLFGLDTLKAADNSNSYSILWSTSLNPDATSHRIVHGGPSSSSGVDGGASNHGTNEMLIVSTLPDEKLEYKCIDGINGHVLVSEILSISSLVSQIIPMRSSIHGKEQGGCKQVAVLLFADGSVDTIPRNIHTNDFVMDTAKNGSRNGLYAHTLDLVENRFRSFKVYGKNDDSKSLSAEQLGETLFKGEQIVKVAYPERGEVVTSPATILGDDSLLLKYLNPHLVVIVTHGYAESSTTSETDPFASALLSENGGLLAKKKPLGVTNTGDIEPKTTHERPTPKLFINLIDTVSSKILYRISHPFASIIHPIPVSISENWIIYAFFNTDTKRTDIGVLTLHEGMIDKHGITAFQSQVEQELEFSSFTSEKPIVLNKIFSLGQPKAVTALGMTQTARGISSKHVLLALGSNQVISVDRRWLDPRRPSGEPKKSEKLEGLQRYAPVLPMIPQLTASYHLNVEGVSSLSTTSAKVESHTLILAHGGPDIFFTRLSPSKGFDLLPDSFNKGVLSLVVLALMGVLLFLQKLNTKKSMEIAWS